MRSCGRQLLVAGRRRSRLRVASFGLMRLVSGCGGRCAVEVVWYVLSSGRSTGNENKNGKRRKNTRRFMLHLSPELYFVLWCTFCSRSRRNNQFQLLLFACFKLRPRRCDTAIFCRAQRSFSWPRFRRPLYCGATAPLCRNNYLAAAAAAAKQLLPTATSLLAPSPSACPLACHRRTKIKFSRPAGLL